MSNKTAKIKRKLVPKLRFPEFSDSEWKNEPLKDLYSFKSTNSYPRDMLNYKKGSVKNIHYGDIHTKFSTLFDIKNEEVPFVNPLVSISKIKQESYCVEGDIIFADASEDLNDIGKSIEIINVRGENLISGLHTLLARQKAKQFIVGFGGYLFASNSARSQIKKEAQGAKVLGISATRLSNIRIGFPLDKKEQQKIADCLSSIDDLIGAQGQKVGALKKYKKGLMQQLFPAENETLPKLRFPDFQYAEEWKVKCLGKLFFDRQETGFLNLPLLSLTDKDGVIPQENTNRKNNSSVNKSKYLRVCPGDIVYNTMRMWEGRSALAGSEGVVSPAYTVCKPNNQVCSSFFSYYFKRRQLIECFRKYSQGLVKDTLNLKFLTFSKISILSPSFLEQKKIANCLSSIDDAISVQTQKLEALKAHKKGLIQQLFPTLEELRNE